MKKPWIILLLVLMLFQARIPTMQAAEPPTFQDALLAILEPHISKAIIGHYGYLKSYALQEADILSISQEQKDVFDFNVTIMVKTFKGAKNPPYGKETLKFRIQPSDVQLLEFTHEGDEEEKKVEQFYKEAIQDLIRSFHLNVLTYDKQTFQQVQYKAEADNAYNSLQSILDEVVTKELNPYIQPPYKNVILPVTYLKGSEGFVLFKKTDGTNRMLVLKQENGLWKVIGEKTEEGKKMEADLLWYM